MLAFEDRSLTEEAIRIERHSVVTMPDTRKLMCLLGSMIIVFLVFRSYLPWKSVIFYRFEDKILPILAFGDSLTEGLYGWPLDPKYHPYTFELERLIKSFIKMHSLPADVLIINEGKSGERLRKTMQGRLEDIISNWALKFKVAIILAGTNDLVDIVTERKRGLKPNDICRYLKELHSFCHDNRIITVALSIPENALDKSPQHDNMTLYRTLMNDDLRQFAQMNNPKTIFIDISKELPRNSSSYWDDGLHLSPSGYDKMGRIIFEGIRPLLKNWLSKAS